MGEVKVSEDREQSRFEIRVDGVLAGYAEYSRRPGIRAFTHTRIDDDFGGQGLGGKLVGSALQATRDAGDEVLPFCEFVGAYITRHPETLDLVPPAMRSYFELV
jgi:predicted GNAT family acetyltransferase